MPKSIKNKAMSCPRCAGADLIKGCPCFFLGLDAMGKVTADRYNDKAAPTPLQATPLVLQFRLQLLIDYFSKQALKFHAGFNSS